MSRPEDLVQGTLDMLLLKILALEPMNGFAVSRAVISRLTSIGSSTFLPRFEWPSSVDTIWPMGVRDESWRVLDDKQWAVEQCKGYPLPGYLLVLPTIRAGTLSEIPPDAVGKLGRLLQRVVGALESVLAPERIYILQFGEETQDVHFHVFPRTTKLTMEYLQDRPQYRTQVHGPLLFEWARDRYRGSTASADTIRVLDALRKHFGEGGQTRDVETNREQTPRNGHS